MCGGQRRQTKSSVSIQLFPFLLTLPAWGSLPNFCLSPTLIHCKSENGLSSGQSGQTFFYAQTPTPARDRMTGQQSAEECWSARHGSSARLCCVECVGVEETWGYCLGATITEMLCWRLTRFRACSSSSIRTMRRTKITTFWRIDGTRT